MRATPRLLLGFSLAVTSVLVPWLAGSAPASAATAPVVHVAGNRLVDNAGTTVRLLGVDKSGSEFACVQGWGFFDGPTDATTVAAIRAWGTNAVRVPLNEDCWLGINGVSAKYSGAAYRSAISDFVGRLHAAGLVAILDLHWNAPGTTKATAQQVMADADHSPAFWQSVATTFRNDPGVVFDLYNEPHGISWQCWRDGCVTAAGWRAAGMQQLVDAVRSTGARQPLLLGGLNWSGDLSGWLSHRPSDPLNQLAASAHIYNFSQCATATCWDSSIATTARSVPVVTGELGENDCAGGFVSKYMDWADAHGVSYLGWTWNTWSCSTGPALISSSNGTPTAFGRAVRDHLSVSARPLPTTPTPPPTVTPTPSPTPTSTAPSAPAPVGPVVYDFEATTQSWRPEGSHLTLTRSSAAAHAGASSLAVTSELQGRAGEVLRFHSPLETSSGLTGHLVAWVRVPAGAPVSGWRGQIEMQDSDWHWLHGPVVTLVPGVWTPVSFSTPSTSWTTHRAVGIQVTADAHSAGQVTVLVDGVQE